jgi:hypothetical protein
VTADNIKTLGLTRERKGSWRIVENRKSKEDARYREGAPEGGAKRDIDRGREYGREYGPEYLSMGGHKGHPQDPRAPSMGSVSQIKESEWGRGELGDAKN